MAFHHHTSYLYTRPGGGMAEPPPGCVVIATTAMTRQQALQLADNLGTRDDCRRYLGKATGYFVLTNGQPVAIGWRFKRSSLLWRVGHGGGVYLGGFRVAIPYRGQGYYPGLLRYLCALPECRERRLYAQTAPDNPASQRGLKKAGFQRAGMLRALMWRGIALRVRLETDGRKT